MIKPKPVARAPLKYLLFANEDSPYAVDSSRIIIKNSNKRRINKNKKETC